MITIGSLCSGAGGLDLAVADVLGDVRTAWVADPDPDAARVLAARFPDAPNLGDITAVDWRRVEPVDVVVAGFPCQDISNAGKRAGIDGARSGVWRHVAAAIGILRPNLALLENVAALLVRGGTRVTADLAALGYVGSWRTLRASDVGAPHRRERVFIAAADPDREPVRAESVAVGGGVGAAVAGGDSPRALMPTPTERGSAGPGLPSADLAGRRYAQGRRMLDDAVALLPTPAAWEATRSGPHARYGNGQPQLSQIVTLLPTPRGSEGAKGGPNQRGSSGDLTLTSSVMLLPTPTASTGGAGDRDGGGMRLATLAAVDRWAQYGPAIRRWEAILGRPAPEPTVTGKRGGRRLSARFTEWLMGWPDGWVTDVIDNTAALRLCGNGVVRQQGAAAYRLLGVGHG